MNTKFVFICLSTAAGMAVGTTLPAQQLVTNGGFESGFTGWTRDGMLRHPTFIELRSDKPASQVVRESPVN